MKTLRLLVLLAFPLLGCSKGDQPASAPQPLAPGETSRTAVPKDLNTSPKAEFTPPNPNEPGK